MLKVAMTRILKKRGLLDMPHEILFEIFRSLPKGKLRELSRFCPKLRDVAGDTRLWKNVYIKYEQQVVAFEELYSEPWPVKVVDLKKTKIEPPVSSETYQVVKVKELNLSLIEANKVTMEAILAKYQCTALYLDFNRIDSQNHIMGIAPESFSKQTDLEVLTLSHTGYFHMLLNEQKVIEPVPTQLWLAPVLNNCKNLKTLNLSFNSMLDNLQMLNIVRNLPKSLEKLFIVDAGPEDSFFKLLAKSAPHLKELALDYYVVKCQSLFKLQFLEIFYVYYHNGRLDSYYVNAMCRNLSKHLIKLKAVYMGCDLFHYSPETMLVNHLTTLEPQGIIVGEIYCQKGSPYPKNHNLWKVSKAK